MDSNFSLFRKEKKNLKKNLIKIFYKFIIIIKFSINL
jgi:hypothetical protein